MECLLKNKAGPELGHTLELLDGEAARKTDWKPVTNKPWLAKGSVDIEDLY